MKHTKTPWAINGDRIESDKEHGWVNDGWRIAECFGQEWEANAAFIVRCCNSFEDALGLLKEATKELKDEALRNRIKSFLEQNK